jgi:hypothetical protein
MVNLRFVSKLSILGHVSRIIRLLRRPGEDMADVSESDVSEATEEVPVSFNVSIVRDGQVKRRTLPGNTQVELEISELANGHISPAHRTQGYLAQLDGYVDVGYLAESGLNRGRTGLPVPVIKRVAWQNRPLEQNIIEDDSRVFEAESEKDAEEAIKARIQFYKNRMQERKVDWCRVTKLDGAISVRLKRTPVGYENVARTFPTTVIYDRLLFLTSGSRNGPASKVCRTGEEALQLALAIAEQNKLTSPYVTDLASFDLARRSWYHASDSAEEWVAPTENVNQRGQKRLADTHVEALEPAEAQVKAKMNFFLTTNQVIRRRHDQGRHIYEEVELSDVMIGDSICVGVGVNDFDEVTEVSHRQAASPLMEIAPIGFDNDIPTVQERFALGGYAIEAAKEASVSHVQPAMYVGAENVVGRIAGVQRETTTKVRVSTLVQTRQETTVRFHLDSHLREEEDALERAQQLAGVEQQATRNLYLVERPDRKKVFNIVSEAGLVIHSIPYGKRAFGHHGSEFQRTRESRIEAIGAIRQSYHVPCLKFSLQECARRQELSDNRWAITAQRLLEDGEDDVQDLHLDGEEGILLLDGDYRFSFDLSEVTAIPTIPSFVLTDDLIDLMIHYDVDVDDAAIISWGIGFWLGDGFSNRTAFAVGDSEAGELVPRLQELALAVGAQLRNVRRDNNHAVSTWILDPPDNIFRRLLRGLGCYADKNLTFKSAAMIVQSSPNLRRHFLAGLIDSDGTSSGAPQDDLFVLGQSMRADNAAASHKRILTVASAVAGSLGFDSRLARVLDRLAIPIMDENYNYIPNIPREEIWNEQGRRRVPFGRLLFASANNEAIPVVLGDKTPPSRNFEAGDHPGSSGWWRWVKAGETASRVTGIRLRRSNSFFFSNGWHANCYANAASAAAVGVSPQFGIDTRN